MSHAQWKICNITFIYGRIAEFPRLKGNRGLGILLSLGSASWGQIRTPTLGIKLMLVSLLLLMTLLIGRIAPIARFLSSACPATKDLTPRSHSATWTRSRRVASQRVARERWGHPTRASKASRLQRLAEINGRRRRPSVAGRDWRENWDVSVCAKIG